MIKQSLLFEELREVWKDIRSQTANTWHLAAFSFGVAGIAANVLITGNPPLYGSYLGYFVFLFMSTFFLIPAWFQYWIRETILAGISFIREAEGKLEETEAIEHPIFVQTKNGKSELSYPPLEEYGFDSFASKMLWVFCQVVIAVSSLWVYQAVVILEPLAEPLIFFGVNMLFLLNFAIIASPLSFIIGALLVLAKNEQLNTEYGVSQSDSISYLDRVTKIFGPRLHFGPRVGGYIGIICSIIGAFLYYFDMSGAILIVVIGTTLTGISFVWLNRRLLRNSNRTDTK